MKILGISAFYHDSAAALIEDGQVLFAAQEERFTRLKNDDAFPEHAIKFCLDEAGVSLQDLDAIAFYDKPFLKFERLLETYYAFAPKGFLSFIKAMPVWLKDKLFIKQIIRKKLKILEGLKQLETPIYFPEHHLSHAASAFYTSPFKRAAFLTVDGVGEWATTSYGIADGDKGIRVYGELHFPDSLGLFYSAFTYFLGFKVNSGEYKMMGLAPYSKKASQRVLRFKQTIYNDLVDLKSDGSIHLNTKYFEYPVGLRMVDPKVWEGLFGIKKREPDAPLEQVHADLALAAQLVLEDILIKIITFIKQETQTEFLCLAGGVALNCVANTVLYNQKIFKDIYVQPAAGDAGGALGAALALNFLKEERPFEGLKTPFQINLGPSFSNLDFERVLRKHQCAFEYVADEKTLLQKTTTFIKNKKVVGWFQGRSEFGPRALGYRSILANPTDPDMQYKLNMKIKFREGFRPFAPVVCEEDYDSYFESGKPSHYMLFTSKVKAELRRPLPENFEVLSLEEKRKIPKSDLPAITHIDYSARVQAINKNSNPIFWSLLQEFKKQTGVGVLINTSFNVKDEPIVNTPEDAYLCFKRSGMDVLILGHYIIEK